MFSLYFFTAVSLFHSFCSSLIQSNSDGFICRLFQERVSPGNRMHSSRHRPVHSVLTAPGRTALIFCSYHHHRLRHHYTSSSLLLPPTPLLLPLYLLVNNSTDARAVLPASKFAWMHAPPVQ